MPSPITPQVHLCYVGGKIFKGFAYFILQCSEIVLGTYVRYIYFIFEPAEHAIYVDFHIEIVCFVLSCFTQLIQQNNFCFVKFYFQNL